MHANLTPVPRAVVGCAAAAVQAVRDRHWRVLAIDTETSGLTGVVIQIGGAVLDGDGNESEVFSELLLPPPGFDLVLHPRAVAVHGITRERLLAEGVPARPALARFVARLAGVRVVAHNAAFDVARLNHTLAAYGMAERVDAAAVFCTMQAAKRHCGLVGAGGRPRCPKNAELYALLGGADDCGALHDAANDARITARSFVLGRRRGWWA